MMASPCGGSCHEACEVTDEGDFYIKNVKIHDG